MKKRKSIERLELMLELGDFIRDEMTNINTNEEELKLIDIANNHGMNIHEDMDIIVQSRYSFSGQNNERTLIVLTTEEKILSVYNILDYLFWEEESWTDFVIKIEGLEARMLFSETSEYTVRYKTYAYFTNEFLKKRKKSQA